MTSDIIKLLGKKGKLTGAEVGNLVILNTVYQIKNNSTETPINKAELQTAINSVTGNPEIRAYNQKIQLRDFIYEVMSKKLLIDEMRKKQYLILKECIASFLNKVKELGFNKVKKMTFTEFEAYRKERLHDYLYDADGKEKEVTYIFIILEAIVKLYDTEPEMFTIVSKYGDKLTKEEEAFLRKYITQKEYKNSPISNLLANNKPVEAFLTHIKELIKEEDVIHTSEGDSILTDYEPQQKDVAVYLDSYIDYLMNDKEKGKADIVKVIKRYEEVVEYAKDYLDRTLFNGDIKDFTIDDLLDTNITYKELLEKYNYNAFKRILGTDEIILTDNKEELLIDSFRHFNYLDKKGTGLELGESLQLLEADVDLLYNLKMMLYIVADYTGLKEIKELIPEDKEQSFFDMMCIFLSTALSEIDDLQLTEEQADFIKTALKDIEKKLADDTVKKASEEVINNCRKLLNNSSNFNDIRDDFYFSLLTGKIEKSL